MPAAPRLRRICSQASRNTSGRAIRSRRAGNSAHRSASRPHRARAEVHGRFQRGSWLAPCPNPSLATRATPKSGSFPRPELCCLGGRQYYYPVRLPRHCPGLRLWPLPGRAPAAIDLPTGAVGSPQSPGRPSLHAGPSTPERFQAAPESKARTAAFARLAQARPARSLTGLSFDAAGFNFLTACSFVPPPFGSASRRLPEISLPGSSGGLPGPDSHRLVASPCWAVRELLKLGIAVSARSIRRYRRRGPAGPPSQIWHTFLAGPACPRRSAPRLRTSRLMLGATRFDRPATPKMTAKSCQSWHCSAGVTRPSTSARGVTAVAGVEASASVCG
jgi:hypothetical protein